MPQRITIDLDRVGEAALSVLTSDGTSIVAAVHAAIIDAAEYRSVPTGPELRASENRGRVIEVLALMGDPPPLSASQRDLLEAFFGGTDVPVGQT